LLLSVVRAARAAVAVICMLREVMVFRVLFSPVVQLLVVMVGILVWASEELARPLLRVTRVQLVSCTVVVVVALTQTLVRVVTVELGLLAFVALPNSSKLLWYS
jgi:hypothetical protein